MEIKQKFNTFIREFDECIFIYNSESTEELIVDKSGGLFLSQITREWKSLNVVINELAKIFDGTDKEEITSDAIDFFGYLQEKGFVDIKDNERRTLDIKINKQNNGSIISPIVKQIPDTTQVHLLKMYSKHPRLLSLQIELTNICNERCIHCYIPHKYKTKALSWEHYDKILEQASQIDVLTLVINGGEPLCHPFFLDMLKKAMKYDFNIKILSNLTKLTDEIIECMKNSHVSEIQTSIYSMDPSIHDEITKVNGSLDLTLKNLLKLKDNGMGVRISCVLMKQNKDSYKDVIQWAKEHQIPLSIDYILFGRYDYTTDNLNYRLSKEEVEIIIRDTIENDETYVKKIQSTDFKLLDNYYREFGVSCNVGRSTLCISSDGTYYPCIGWQGYKLGNIDEQSLQDVWNSAKLNRLRNISMFDFSECRKCKDKFFCSRCLARNANENNGDFMRLSNQTCELAHLNRSICKELLHVDYKPE